MYSIYRCTIRGYNKKKKFKTLHIPSVECTYYICNPLESLPIHEITLFRATHQSTREHRAASSYSIPPCFLTPKFPFISFGFHTFVFKSYSVQGNEQDHTQRRIIKKRKKKKKTT